MGNTSSRITAQDQAILDLKTQRDKLHQYQRRITALTDRETAAARAMLARGDRARALLALRRKKYQESLLAKTDAQLAQLEQLAATVEFARIQKDVLFGLRQGTRVLREIHAEMGGIENVERLMGETADAIAYQREVSEILAGRMSNQDEEEVEDELAAMEAEVTAASAGVQRLPSVPDTKLPAQQAGEEVSPEPAQPRAQTERQAMLAS